MDTDWNEYIDIVKFHLEDEYGCLVEEATGEEDRFEPDSNTIYINSRQWAESRFYTLLHEAGHLLIGTDWHGLLDTNQDMFASCHYDGRAERRRDFKVNKIIEEGMSWKFGFQLSEMLDLDVDVERYNRFMTKHMMTYLMWSVE